MVMEEVVARGSWEGNVKGLKQLYIRCEKGQIVV